MNIIALVFALLVQSAIAISIRVPMVTTDPTDGATITQDRFRLTTPGSTLNSEFTYSAYDFSGVGWDPADTRKSVTLISDSHFLAASHFTPSGTVNFRDSSGTVISRNATYTTIPNPTGGGLSGNSDLIVGTLSAPIDMVSTGISPYKILDPSLTTSGQNLLIYGQRGRVGRSFGIGSTDITVGSTEGHSGVSVYHQPTGADEDAFFTNGDSGGPSFIIGTDGKLILAGIHWAVDSTSYVDATLNFDTNVPFYLDEIEDETGPGVVETSILIGSETAPPFPTPLVLVPEPSSSMLIMTSLGLFCLRRRR